MTCKEYQAVFRSYFIFDQRDNG